MNTTINLHAWIDVKLQAEASFGSHGCCILKMKAGETELYLFLPISQYSAVARAATLLDRESSEHPDTKPFSTYPEDREKLLAMCRAIEAAYEEEVPSLAYTLADHVKAILEDEAISMQSEAA